MTPRIKLQEIADVNKKIRQGYLGKSLFAGCSGRALFFGYLYLLYGKRESLDKTYQFLNKAIDNLEKDAFNYEFGSGMSGFLWTIQHLVNLGVLEKEYKNIVDEYLELVQDSYESDLAIRRHDFMTGLVGKGKLMLETIEFDASKLAYGKKMLQALYTLKETINERDIWKDYYVIQRKKKDVKLTHVNLGLAHGQASILSLLCDYSHFMIEEFNIKKSIKDISLLILESIIKKDNIQYFPTDLIENKPITNYKSRMAWCHGDPGVVTALLKASKVLNDNEMNSLVTNHISNWMSQRKALKGNGIYDTSLCHGSSGLSIIYKTIYDYTLNPKMLDLSKFWINKTLSLANHTDGLAGFKTFTAEKETPYLESYGFLTGISGTGLALITHINPNLDGWKKALLL